jgi:hypothetical protein
VNARSHPVEQAANPAAASPRGAATGLRSSAKRLVRGVPDLLLRLPAPSTDYAVRPVNLGTAEPPLTGTALKPTSRAVQFGTSRPLLPVWPSEEPP